MFRKVHDKLGTAGLVIAIAALVAALGGAAVAAVPGLNPKQKQQVRKIAHKYAGKDGSNGLTGPQGLQGPKGDPGAPGANGKNGADGISPEGNQFTGEEGPCTEGGVKFTGTTTTFVCNGQPGPTDTKLPSGKTLKGLWQFQVPSSSFGLALVTISFPLQVTPAPDEFHWIAPGEGPTEECPGSADEPKAKAGHLCFYIENLINAEPLPFSIATDASLGWRGEFFLIDKTKEAFGYGSWAVTAK
jgi:uncharacterized low-complexity protein